MQVYFYEALPKLPWDDLDEKFDLHNFCACIQNGWKIVNTSWDWADPSSAQARIGLYYDIKASHSISGKLDGG